MSKQPKLSNNIYITLKSIYENSALKDKISYKDYELISDTFFHLLTRSMIEEGKVYYLPPTLGTIGIYKTKKTKKMIDFDLFKKTGVKANIRNHHTHGSMAKVHWRTIWPQFRVSNFGHPTIFRFKIARDSARYLAKQIKENNTISKYYDF